MVYVIKANGEKAKFDRSKILHTCKRSGVPPEVAESIVGEVEGILKDGMSTREILDIVLKRLDEYEAAHSQKYELKKAVADLDPSEHEFEKYIAHLLRAQGYKTDWDKIIEGECIEHQIDVIAEKDGKTYLVECKHHVNPHRFCGLGTALQTWAAFDDINRGPLGKEYENVWLVTNTKFSEHAIRYAKAKNMSLIGWNYPEGQDLRSLIETKGMYPITILKVDKKIHKKFSDAGILLLQELVGEQIGEIYGKTRIEKKLLGELLTAAHKILGQDEVATR